MERLALKKRNIINMMRNGCSLPGFMAFVMQFYRWGKGNKRKEAVMKKYLSLAVIVCGLMLVAAPAMAVDCSTITNLGQLISTGCTIQDKVFSGFSYAPTNAVHDAAANINATDIFTAPGPGVDQHGWSFVYNNGTWAGGFTLSYTISVSPSSPLVYITSSKDQIFDGQTGTALPSVVDTQTFGVMNLSDIDNASQTQSLFYAPTKSVTTTSVVSVGSNGPASYQQNWFETTVGVPEPSMLLLLGFGFVSVAGLRRKFKK